MKSIKLMILGFLLVIAMSFVNAVSINQANKTITEQDSLYFEASGEDIVYYEWDFNNAIPEKTVNGRLIFYTSTTHDGKFGETKEEALANVDAFCNERLRAAGIPGTCKAILSTSYVDAINRIPESNGFYNTLGQVVANNKVDFLIVKGADIQLRAPISDEFGQTIAGNEYNPTPDSYVWTGSTAKLELWDYVKIVKEVYTCTDWTSNGDGHDTGDYLNSGFIGLTGNVIWGVPWHKSSAPCNEQAHIYGVQNEPIKLYEGTKIRMKKPGIIKFNIPGQYTITLKGYKADNSYEESSIIINVLENKAPVLTINEQAFNENQKVIFPVIAEDPENDVLTFSVETNIAGYSFNTNTDSCINEGDINIITDYYFGAPERYNAIVDLNNDGEIDILDIAKISDKFGICKGDANYDAKLDLSNKIRIFSWQTNYLNAGIYNVKFTVTDTRGKSSSKTITITINDVNRLPSKPALTSPLDNANNIPIDAKLTWQKSADADNDILTYNIYFGESPAPEFKINTDSLTYSPILGYSKTYYWKIVATDGKDSVSSDIYKFTTMPPNNPPVANSLSISTNEDTAKQITLICSDLDVDPLSYIIVSNPSHGSLSLTGNIATYTPILNYNGPDLFTYKCNDNKEDSNTANVLIAVNSVNDIPTADIINSDTVIVVGSTINFQGQGNDIEGAVSYSWDFDDSNGIQSESTLQNPSKLFNTMGTFKVTLTVTDSDGAAATDKITVTVTDITGNHAPVINTFIPANTNILIGDNVAQQFTTTSSDYENNIKSKIWYVDDVQEGTGDSFTFNKALAKTYIVKFVVTDIANLNATKTWNVIVSNVPVTANYNIPQLSGDLSSVANFYVNKEQYGKIDFLQALDLRDVVDLDNNIIIGDGIIGINTAVYPQLNRQATITMKGLTFTETPTIYYTTGFTTNKAEINTVCNFCSNITYSNGILTFKVDHFTTFAVKQVSKLIIEDLDVKVGDKTDSNVLNGETINQDAKPGSTITLSLDIRNNLGKDINDITVKATLNAIDDGEDIEEESSEFDLNIGKKKGETIKLNIPYKVDEGSYDLEIHVEGEDEDSKLQQTDWTVKLVVSKKSHEIVISKADLGNELLECVKTTNLNIEILNTGNEDEDDVKIVVKSDDLGIDFEQDNIKLTNDVFSDDSKYAKTIRIQVSNDFNEGIYPIRVEVYRNSNLEASKELSLQIGICQVKEVAQAEKGISIVSENKAVPKVKEAEKIDIELIAALIGGIFVVLILIIAVLYLGFRKK